MKIMNRLSWLPCILIACRAAEPEPPLAPTEQGVPHAPAVEVHPRPQPPGAADDPGSTTAQPQVADRARVEFASSGDGRLHGKLSRERDGAALAGVNVIGVWHDQEGLRHGLRYQGESALTDERGVFLLRTTDAWPDTVWIEAPGCICAETTVGGREAVRTPFAATLGPNAVAIEVHGWLIPETMQALRVLDADGRPMPNVAVEAQANVHIAVFSSRFGGSVHVPRGSSGGGTTGTDGTCQLPGSVLSQGTTIRLSRDGEQLLVSHLPPCTPGAAPLEIIVP